MTAVTETTRRFEFGANWQAFLQVLDEDRIARAMTSLNAMLGVDDLHGRTFLDIGCGSGLFSLAASRLGADVLSFDFDPRSVAATQSLRQSLATPEANWSVMQGSVLDEGFLQGLGTFDVVYAWGVLHHTGDMWRALTNVTLAVKPGGRLFLAIYNDQGWRSRAWRAVKKTYCVLPPALRFAVLAPAFVRLWAPTFARDTLHGEPLRTWRSHRQNRGMSAWHDVRDWVGGYPFEVASPASITRFFEQRGFTPLRTEVVDGIGCNQFVFLRTV